LGEKLRNSVNHASIEGKGTHCGRMARRVRMGRDGWEWSGWASSAHDSARLILRISTLIPGVGIMIHGGSPHFGVRADSGVPVVNSPLSRPDTIEHEREPMTIDHENERAVSEHLTR